ETIIQGAKEVVSGSEESSRSIAECQKASDSIATAAEELSSATEESVKSSAEQSQALSQAAMASQNLADLADDLKTSIDSSKVSEEVASSAEELSTAVQEINRSAAQISTALGQILSSSQQQAAASEESSTAITQVQRSSEIGKERAAVAVEKGEAISTLLATNKQSVDELINGVNTALAETQKSRDKVNNLADIARQIDKIVDAIGAVAIKTSLLAVCGSIEAARAGTYGKGFAVVANDILNLANDADANNVRIKDTVKALQDQIALVSTDLLEIATFAGNEAEKARALTTNLETMESDMAEVLEGNRVINATSGEIMVAAQEIAKGSEQIASAATEAEQSVQEASLAAEQQAQGAEALAGAIEEIASLADDIQSF
ncbi:MAG: methyl-accepting chemotaxis protein, partial [Candidatus Electrothrix sp. ATG1]|nr:methyl-accepting chemotaxis protein [Candidatus Electrothrix sp. ATG1]